MGLSNQLTMPRVQLIPGFAEQFRIEQLVVHRVGSGKVAVGLRCVVERVEGLHGAPLLVLSDHADVDGRVFARSSAQRSSRWSTTLIQPQIAA
jgi:hypothetical protein